MLIQNVILLGITLPMNDLLLHPAAFSSTDAALTVLFLALLSFETVADQQQWNFHQHKKAQKAAGREVHPGFLDKGLWSVSRHPNFFAEQSQWWVVYLFSVASVGFSTFSWVGAAVLTALFIGSTRFTEEITSGKYPEYKQYQERVSMLVPWFAKSDDSKAAATN